jgi:hypothetical protein
MSEDCPKCINGWIKIGENAYDMCDCLLGQAMRQPQRFILHKPKDDTDPEHEEAFQWFKSKYEGKAT